MALSDPQRALLVDFVRERSPEDLVRILLLAKDQQKAEIVAWLDKRRADSLAVKTSETATINTQLGATQDRYDQQVALVDGLKLAL